jgi:hypothetical protein
VRTGQMEGESGSFIWKDFLICSVSFEQGWGLDHQSPWSSPWQACL